MKMPLTSCFQQSATAWPVLISILVCFLFFSVRVSAEGWVAVGENGTILTSDDGITWSSATSPTRETLRGVYSDNEGNWVAAGQSGTIINSPDAVVWTEQTSGNTNALWGTVFAGGQWIVSGGSGRIVTSPDSAVSTSVNDTFSFTLYDIAYDGSGLYVVVGFDNSLPTVLTSSNARNWVQEPPTPSNSERLYGISYGDAEWVAIGDTGVILTTTEPVSRVWEAQASGTSANLRDIIYNGTDLYVVVGVGGLIITSPDARVWTSSPSGTNVDLVGVEYDAGL
jgi:hypothetical protein